jgi:hypothetical protein
VDIPLHHELLLAVFFARLPSSPAAIAVSDANQTFCSPANATEMTGLEILSLPMRKLEEGDLKGRIGYEVI